MASLHISGALIAESEIQAALESFPRVSFLRLEGCQKVTGNLAAEAILTGGPSLACVCIVRSRAPHTRSFASFLPGWKFTATPHA